MQPQETKFSFIYHELTQRILDGQILPGHCLPSSRMLCEQFRVSRYTINRVLDALQSDGLIEIQPRLAPVVSAAGHTPDSSDTLLEILAQKDSILQVYQTFALIMPELFTFASQDCELEILPHYKQAVKVSRFGRAAGGWRPPSNLGYDILKLGASPLFSELYSTFDLYNHLTFFTEECPYFSKLFSQGTGAVAGAIIDILKGKDPALKRRQLSVLYQNLTDSIAGTLEHLSGTVSALPEQSSVSFSWNPLRGQDYFHAKIVDDLNQKIGTGVYTAGMYLPSEKQLAEQYGVSISTIRKALSELDQRGFVKTLNGKGTLVTEPNDTKIRQLILTPGYGEKALRYLHALQLMILIISPAALAAAPRLTQEDITQLAKKLAAPGSIHLATLFEAVLDHTSLEPLYVILSETSRLLKWGHYFTYYPSKKHSLSHLNRQAATALAQLVQGDRAAFADTMAGCYRYILSRVTKFMVEKCQFQKAASIRIPEN